MPSPPAPSVEQSVKMQLTNTLLVANFGVIDTFKLVISTKAEFEFVVKAAVIYP
jgi:hypothetical protein